MESGRVWVDGELVAVADATVPVGDRGLTLGYGVFETLKVVRGRAFALGRHLARLHRSAGRMGLAVPVSDDRLREAVDVVIAANDPAADRLRITLTGGPAPGPDPGDGPPTLIVGAGPAIAYEPDTAAITVPWPRNERSLIAGVKSTSYGENVVVLAEATEVGASEAILPNTAGRLCEGTRSNVFVVVGGRVLTPSLLSGCLPGVTRELVLELLDEADEEDLPMEILAEADEVLITSSTRGAQPLRLLDGRPLPGRHGPVARRAAAAFADLVARDLDP